MTEARPDKGRVARHRDHRTARRCRHQVDHIMKSAIEAIGGDPDDLDALLYDDRPKRQQSEGWE